MGTGVEMTVGLLGRLNVERAGESVALPKSRKVRALLAYLALANRPVSRSALCDLLWDSPSDPRGELRWSLSRLRSVLDTPSISRVRTHNDTVELNLEGCRVDAFDALLARKEGFESLGRESLEALSRALASDFLDGLELDGNPQFTQWLITERRRFRTLHTMVLERLALLNDAGSSERLQSLEEWAQATPFDRVAHELLLRELVQCGRYRDAEQHLATTIRLYESEGADWLPIRAAWRAAKSARIEQCGRVDTATAERLATPAPRRAAIAVMPFLDATSGEAIRTSSGDGLTDDIITRLAKLRILSIISRGTVTALSDRGVAPEDAGRLLGVDYVASGVVVRRGGRIAVKVELVECANRLIVWTDLVERREGDFADAFDAVCNSIVASVAEEIESVERNRAILKPPTSLDAWDAYHRGLWHMYRFSRPDNERAAYYFTRAVALDPSFSRAYAALSFTHFQDAFLLRTHEREQSTARAYETACESVLADDRDPAAHWAMGRALWLQGEEDGSLRELERSVDLSPNFALAHYTVGFVHSQSGDPRLALAATRRSQQLSPFDPLQFAMLGTRAMSHARLGEFEAAVECSRRAVARPNVHEHVLAIGAHCLAVAGEIDEALWLAQVLRQRRPGYTVEDFFTAFRFSPRDQAMFRRGAELIGLA